MKKSLLRVLTSLNKQVNKGLASKEAFKSKVDDRNRTVRLDQILSLFQIILDKARSKKSAVAYPRCIDLAKV